MSVVMIVLDFLGFGLTDADTPAYALARTWVLASLDEYEDCFEGKTPEQIRAEFRAWRNSLYESNRRTT